MFILEHYCDVKSEFDAKVPQILFKHLSRFVDYLIVIYTEIRGHKTVKTNDKIRCFGVVMTPLSRKK